MQRVMTIYKALKRTNRKAALDYLDLSSYREKISAEAAFIKAGVKNEVAKGS